MFDLKIGLTDTAANAFEPVTPPASSAANAASSLVAMPFLGTRVLAGVMLIAGLLYVAFAHLLTRRQPEAPAETAGQNS
jgi:hypothetical protein